MVKKSIKYVMSDVENIALSPLHSNMDFGISYLSGALTCYSINKWADFQKTLYPKIVSAQAESGEFNVFRRIKIRRSNATTRTAIALIILQLRKGNLSFVKQGKK